MWTRITTPLLAQFIRVKWVNECPFLLFNDNNKMKYIQLENNINIHKTNNKLCLGYYDLQLKKEIPCPNETKFNDTGQKQCDLCTDLGAFSSCIRCMGEKCLTRSAKSIEFCNQEHNVYLAYFDGDIKVGTTASYRGTDRLLDQGAIYSIFIATTPNGKIARYLETLISEYEVITRVSQSKKMKNIVPTENSEVIISKLLKKYRQLKRLLPKHLVNFFIEPRINDFSSLLVKPKKYLKDTQHQLDLFSIATENERDTFKNYQIATDYNEILGEHVAIIGSVLILNRNLNYCYNLNKLSGYVLKIN